MSETGFLDNHPALTPDGLFSYEDGPAYIVLDTGVRYEDENTGFYFKAGKFYANIQWGASRDAGNRVVAWDNEVTLYHISDEGESESAKGKLLSFESFDGCVRLAFETKKAQYEVIANSATVHLIKYIEPVY